MANDENAKQLIAEYRKKVDTGKSFFDGFALFEGNCPFKIDDDIECNQHAANLYKTAGNWSNAGFAFRTAAKLQAKMSCRDGRYEAATNYANAANCFKKSGNRKYDKESIFCLKYAIKIFTDMGRLSITAKYHKALAEIYEKSEPPDIGRAVKHYEQAATCFTSSYYADKCLLKVAQYSDNLNDYQEAIKIYEKMANTSLENSLLKDSVKEYFLRAALLHLCVNILNAQDAIQRYGNMQPLFRDSQECKFVETLIRNMEEEDVAGFSNTFNKYSSWHSFYPGYYLNVTKFRMVLPSGDCKVMSVSWKSP